MGTASMMVARHGRLLFFGTLAAGLGMCSLGIGQAAARGLWLHPVTIAGYILGAAALGLGGIVLFRLKVGAITNERRALAALLVIIAVKMALATLYGRLA